MTIEVENINSGAIIRITGATTGASIDVPVRFVIVIT